MCDPLCPQPNNLPSPGAPPPSPAFVLITTSPEQMVLCCFAVTDVRSPPIAGLGISWLAWTAPGVFIISLLHLQEERATATKRRNIAVAITGRLRAAAAHAPHCSAHHVCLGGTDRMHRRQIAASSRQLSLQDTPLAQLRYLSFIDAYVWIKNLRDRGKKKKTDWILKVRKAETRGLISLLTGWCLDTFNGKHCFTA